MRALTGRKSLTRLESANIDDASRFLDPETKGSIVLSWVEGWVPADVECWRLGRGELMSVGELLRSCHDCVAEFAPGTGLAEGPEAVAAGQVMCHGDVAPRNTMFAGGRATAFIDWNGIFVSMPMWDLAHAVWQFTPVCDDADRWLGGWVAGRARLTGQLASWRLWAATGWAPSGPMSSRTWWPR